MSANSSPSSITCDEGIYFECSTERDSDVTAIHNRISDLIESLKCRKSACNGTCTCVTESSQSIITALEQIAAVVEKHPALLDHPEFSTLTPRSPDLHQSLVIVPESHKYAAPTNLDGIFRQENITLISSILSTLVNTVTRGRDKINSKSSDMLRALPKSQGVHVVIGILVVYYAMPNSMGFVVIRRIFDLVVMQNIVLMSLWKVVFDYLDESSGHRNSIVPV
eukprot:c17834_g1_i1.p1 GENE.c17834_g1_i1~~c17834_g1_i1.p1  ORF type:complete len:233 (+),score=60.48 c17834_g1_i1:33-701(+)